MLNGYKSTNILAYSGRKQYFCNDFLIKMKKYVTNSSAVKGSSFR